MNTSKYTSPNRPAAPCSIPVVCIDDRNRPADVPISKWPVKGHPYTVIAHSVMLIQNVQGYILAEIDLSDHFPYTYFRADRFAPADALKSLHEEAERLLQEGKEEYELQEEMI